MGARQLLGCPLAVLCVLTRGLLQKKVRFETYLPVGTFPRGWYIYMIFHDIYTDFYTVSEVG